MEITKLNVKDKIESYLKNIKVKYSMISDSLGIINYELYIGSYECFIQLELSDTDDDVYCVLYTKLDDHGCSLVELTWDNNESEDELYECINELITQTKQINSVLSKIEAKIDQIKELCEDVNLDYETFITVNFEF
jgi:hypothetical protein